MNFAGSTIYSRKIVGWQVFERESAELAAGLVHDICERRGIDQGNLRFTWTIDLN